MRISARTGAALAAAVVIAGVAAIPAPAAEKHKGEIPVTTRSDAAKKLFVNGQYHLDHGRNVKANGLFRQAVKEDPDFAYAWFNLGNAALSAEEFGMATKKALAAAASGKVSDGERLLIEINMTFVNNDADRRMKLAQKITDQYPESMRAWMMRNGAEASLNRHADARESMEKAQSLAPKSVVPVTGLGFSYLFNTPKDFDKSESYFRKAVELEPEEDNHHVNLGDALRAQNELDAARKAYGKATELRPDNGVAFVKKGHVNSFLGNYEEARADYNKGVEVTAPENKALYANYRTFTHVHAGNPAAAVAELDEILASLEATDVAEEQKQGFRAFTLTNQATIALHHGMFEKAEKALTKRAAVLRAQAKALGDDAFRRGQEANIAYFDGQLAARRGDYDKAVALARKNAKLLEPDSNPRKLEAHHDLMGLVHLLQGNHGKAVEHYRKANLNVMYTKYHLALALDGAGKSDEAKAIFKEVADWNFNSVGYALVRKDCRKRVSS